MEGHMECGTLLTTIETCVPPLQYKGGFSESDL